MSYSPRNLLDHVPHAKALAIRIDGIENGRLQLSMPWDARLVGDPLSGVLHDGAVFALLDTAQGLATVHGQTSGGLAATLSMRVDYLRPATRGQRIRAEAFCYHTSQTVAFVRAVATDDDAEHPIAISAATFTNNGRKREAGR